MQVCLKAFLMEKSGIRRRPSGLFCIFFNHTLVLFSFPGVINTDQQNISCVMFHRLYIFLLLYLLKCCLRSLVPFQFHQQSRQFLSVFRLWKVYIIRKAMT